jgi:hypothetical protein
MGEGGNKNMKNYKKILIFPGAFQFVKNYGGYAGVDIWLKNNSDKNVSDADYYIAHSLGANFIFAYGNTQNKKIILINPLIKRRNIFSLLIRGIRFYFSEGIERKKIVSVNEWMFSLKRIFKLYKVDVLEAILKIPKEDIIIIRGKNDRLFCDKESIEIAKNNGLALIEVEAGHNWNEKTAEAVGDILKRK